MSHSILWLGVLFVLLWNSGFIGAESLLPYAEPFTQLFWRYSALAVVLFGYLLLRRRLRWPGWAMVGAEAAVGVLAHAVWLACTLVPIDQGVPAGIVALVVALQPMAVGALSGVVVGERTPALRWLGLTLGFSGVAVVILPRLDDAVAVSTASYFLPLGAVAAMTATALIRRRMESRGRTVHLPLDLALFYQAVAAALVLAVPATLGEGLATRWTAEFLAGMAWLVLAVSLVAYALLFELLRRMEATRMSALFYLGPPVTMIMAWLAFGDTLGGVDIVGLLVVLVGIALVRRRGPAGASDAESP